MSLETGPEGTPPVRAVVGPQSQPTPALTAAYGGGRPGPGSTEQQEDVVQQGYLIQQLHTRSWLL